MLWGTLFSSLWSAARRKSSLSCSGSPVCERLSIPPQLQWCHSTWWAAQGGLTLCIHFRGMGSAPLLSLHSSFLGLLGMGRSTDQLLPYRSYELLHTQRHSPEMLALVFSISWCRKKPDQEANFLDEEKEKLVSWSPKELDYHLVLEAPHNVHPILLHV